MTITATSSTSYMEKIMIGRDRGRRSFTGAAIKRARRKATRRRTREPTGTAELKFIGIRAGLSPKVWLDDVLDQQLKMHLRPEYANQKQMGNLLKITGYLEATKKRMKWTATKQDMMRWFALAEKSRWDRGYGLEKEDAIARWIQMKSPKKINIKRPSEFRAKPTTPYFPRRGSSAGKVATKITGDAQVERDFRKLMETLFSLGDNLNKGMKGVKVKRTYKFK